MRTLLVVAFLPVAVLAASQTSVAATNPCSLLSMAQVSAAFGERAMPPQILNDGGQSGCRWLNKSQSKNLFVTIEPSNIFHSVRTSGPWKAMHGIGDDALWSAGWIYVRKHRTYVGIELSLPGQSDTRADPRLIAVAREVIAHLP